MQVQSRELIENSLGQISRSIRTIANRCNRDPDQIKLIIVTKRQPVEIIKWLMDLGYTDFGESYIKEFIFKTKELVGVHWHYIGRFNRGDVNRIIGVSECIHSVPNLKLLKKINNVAEREKIVQNIFLQVNTSGEASKQGFSPDELLTHIQNFTLEEYQFVCIKGLMTIAPFTDNRKIVRKCFRNLRLIMEKVNDTAGLYLKRLSMGMTNDYDIAIEEGATDLRIGRAIFLSK